MKTALLLLALFLLASCEQTPPTLVNTKHLDHLYDEVSVDGDSVGIIYIYADYPEYNPVEAPGEGIACVDDVARAAVFYLRNYRDTQNQNSLHKSKMLLGFLAKMQAPNGCFYNFIDKNHNIDSMIVNSRTVPNWWTWRALWALSEAYELFNEQDRGLAGDIKKQIELSLPVVYELSENYPRKVEVMGQSFPAWLPLQFAADQAAALILGLLPYYRVTADSALLTVFNQQAEGILAMQYGASGEFPFGAFLSWKDSWHAWGNIQACALASLARVSQDQNILAAASREVNYFYPFLQEKNMLHSFRIKVAASKYEALDERAFEQIAYGLRPMVWGALEMARISKNSDYSRQAGNLACWLLGQNIAGTAMYDPSTGVCFDGINSSEKINRNSGAESTIEALLTLQAIDRDPLARKVLFNFYEQKKERTSE